MQSIMAVQNIRQRSLDYAKAYYCGVELSLKGHDNETLFFFLLPSVLFCSMLIESMHVFFI